MILWIKPSGAKDSEAIAVECGASGAAPQSLTVADALIAAYKAFRPPSTNTVLDYQLLLRGVPLASTLPVAQICDQIVKATADGWMEPGAAGSPVRGGMSPLDPLAKPSIAKRSMIVFEFRLRPEAYVPASLQKQLCSPPRSAKQDGSKGRPTSLSAVINLMLGGRKLAMDAATPIDAQRSTPGPLSPMPAARAKSPKGSAASPDKEACLQSPRPLVVDLRSCLFRERWGTDICAACNTHRRFHSTFSPSVTERRLRLVEKSAASPHHRGVGSSKLTMSPPWSWSGSRVATEAVASTAEDNKNSLEDRSSSSVCRQFKAQWNGRGDVCETCLHPKSLHYINRPAAATTNESESRATPKRACSGSASSRLQRTTCAHFQPHWNNNSVCEHCYRSIELHHDPSSRKWRSIGKRTKPQQPSSAAACRRHGGKVSTLVFLALPWHTILLFCSVEDLFRCACVSRFLASCARPLLAATMNLVLSYEAAHLRQELSADSIDVAEHLSHGGDVAKAHLDALQLLLGQGPLLPGQLTFAGIVDLVHKLSTVDALTLPADGVRAVSRLPPVPAEQDPELSRLATFMRALVDEHVVKNRARRYLAHKQIDLS